MIFDISNCPSKLDTLPSKLLIWQSTSYSRCHDNKADDNSDVIKQRNDGFEDRGDNFDKKM